MKEKIKIENNEVKANEYYNTVGWETEEEITEDARRWEDLREYPREYVSKSRLRLMRHIPKSGENILDMASGPIQYKEYLEYSRNFKKRYCVDLSSEALESARHKISNHGVFMHGDFLTLPFEENFFDCAVSLHTIYHIEKNMQEKAVRKLIYVTKPGKPVIIIYSNPNTLLVLKPYQQLRKFLSFLYNLPGKIKQISVRDSKKKTAEPEVNLYIYPYPNEWWYSFSDVADVSIRPWRSFSSDIQQSIIPDNKIGKLMLKILFRLEDSFPNFFAKNFQYPMIILTKRQ